MYTLTSSKAQTHFGETLDTVIGKGLVKITRRGRQAVIMAPATEQIIRAVKSAYAADAFRRYQEKFKHEQKEPISEAELQKIVEEEREKIANDL